VQVEHVSSLFRMRGDAFFETGFSDFGFLRAKITRIAGSRVSRAFPHAT
jgi:hypothetical protein